MLMIINEYNKDFILKGKIKRGFNQDPLKLKEELNKKKIDNKQEDDKNKEDDLTDEYFIMKKVRHDLKRF